MNDNKKLISIVFLSASAIVWYLFTAIVERVAVYIGLFNDASWQGILLKIIPIVIAIITFIILSKLNVSKEYVNNVLVEVKKVVWPKKQETIGATVVVVIFVLLSGAAFGLFDWFSGMFVGWLLK